MDFSRFDEVNYELLLDRQARPEHWKNAKSHSRSRTHARPKHLHQRALDVHNVLLYPAAISTEHACETRGRTRNVAASGTFTASWLGSSAESTLADPLAGPPSARAAVVHSLPKSPVRAGRPNVSLMSPVSAAPGRLSSRHLRSKQSAESSHDAKPKPPTAAGHGQAVEEGAVTPARAPLKLRTKTSPSAISSGRALQDAVRPQLSERDSIFATHYIPSTSPVTSPERSPERAASVEGAVVNRAGGDMAVSTPQRSSSELSLPLRKDTPTSALSLQLRKSEQDTSRRGVARSSLPLHNNRHSWYDLQALSTSSPLRYVQYDEVPPEFKFGSDVTTPSNGSVDTTDDALELSTERQQYRSWRQGKAKLSGMSIVESQRKQSRVEHGVDKIIDAQMPRPEPAATHVRSRKTSHSLGLFKDHEVEERRQDEKHKLDKIPESRRISTDDMANKAAVQGATNTLQENVKDDVVAVEDGNTVTVSAQRMAHNLPLELLEEIRNHHHLAPGETWQTRYHKAVPAQDQDYRRQQEQKLKALKDEESDREHISSATYIPHHRVAASDSPTDDHMVQHEPEPKTQTSKQKERSDDVDISLRSDDVQDYLHGDMSLSRDPSTANFEQLPKPLIENEPTPSDSENESYSEGYDTAVSEQEETTPTATPLAVGRPKFSPEQRRMQQPPPPIGAVELKPYRHQVGGHTTVYRFSRRAVCKQLNSKENMFYETIEKQHPELLGFMPKYIGVLNVTYRKEQKKRKATISEGESAAANGGNGYSSRKERSGNDPESRENQSDRPDNERVISHSLQAPTAIPQVIFANNRHLIPENLFGLPRRSVTPDLQRTHSFSSDRPGGRSDDETFGSGYRQQRPKAKGHASWAIQPSTSIYAIEF